MLPPSELSKTQVDRLGDRLRKGDISDDDIRLLDTYRRSFAESYEAVVGQIRNQLGLIQPAGPPNPPRRFQRSFVVRVFD